MRSGCIASLSMKGCRCGRRRGAPTAIVVDAGGAFVSRAMDAGAYAHDIRVEFIRPGKPVNKAKIRNG